MSLRNTDVKTPGIAAIAKKFNLPVAKVMLLVKQGAQHEKEHNTDESKAEQVARDHIAERPDYYKMLKKAEKTKISMKEESSIGGVRGLGNVSGNPAADTDYIGQYIDTNAMSYEDQNGNILKLIKKAHGDHTKSLGFTPFDPTDVDAKNKILNNNDRNDMIKNKVNKINSKLHESRRVVTELSGGERTDADGGVAGLPKSAYRLNDIKEGEKIEKVKKAVGKVGKVGLVAANLYGLGSAMDTSSSSSPASSVVTAASALPGHLGYVAMTANAFKRGYDYYKSLKKEERTISEITADLVGRAMALSAEKRKKLTSGKMGSDDVKKWWKHQRLIDAGTAKLTGKSKVPPTVKDKKSKKKLKVAKEDVYTRPYEKNSPSNLEDLAVEPRTRAGRVRP